jgi:hypothetical protein
MIMIESFGVVYITVVVLCQRELEPRHLDRKVSGLQHRDQHCL